jgi:hypothetical protein
MSTRRWLVIVGLGAFVVVTAVWAARSWSDTHALATPLGVAQQYVTFECGAPLGKASVQGPERTAYPVVGTPCGHRTERRILAGVDIGVGLVAIIVLAAWKRRPSAPVARADSLVGSV